MNSPSGLHRALAIETSGRTGSVAVAEGGLVLSEDAFPHGLQHTAGLIPMIDRLCRSVGWASRDIDEIYVSAGPGSFTGLRVGITVAKTLAFATGAKLVAVPTVEVLAQNASAEAARVIIVLDAKRGQIFTAQLERSPEGHWNTTVPAHLDTLASMLAKSARPVHLIGDGIPLHADAVWLDPDVIIAPEAAWRATAASVVKVGHILAREGAFIDPDRLTPIYVRKPEAEEK